MPTYKCLFSVFVRVGAEHPPRRHVHQRDAQECAQRNHHSANIRRYLTFTFMGLTLRFLNETCSCVDKNDLQLNPMIKRLCCSVA